MGERAERRAELERQNTSQLLRLPYQAFIDELFARLARAGFTDIHPAQAIVFQQLGAGELRVTELAEQARLTKQYVGRLVAEMEEHGYLERARDPRDGRAQLVRLSPRGRELTRAAEENIAAIEAEWARRVGANGYTLTRRALIDLIVALGQ